MKAVLGLSLLGVALAKPLEERDGRISARQGCTNGPQSRNCWADGFDIDTNPYKSWPSTGNVVEVGPCSSVLGDIH
jgi:hypothetical protein